MGCPPLPQVVVVVLVAGGAWAALPPNPLPDIPDYELAALAALHAAADGPRWTQVRASLNGCKPAGCRLPPAPGNLWDVGARPWDDVSALQRLRHLVGIELVA
jgi:hypothetical protein